ncbi:hypothetical protein P9112_005451 [Eukaryota sp. TZLM1-RC]
MADLSRISEELIEIAEGKKHNHLFIYKVFSIRTSLSPAYLRVETRSMQITINQSRELSDESTVLPITEFDETPESDDQTIDVDEKSLTTWKRVLNMQHNAMAKNTHGYVFDGSILTDGCGVSVQHKRNDLKKCRDKQKDS